jgi:hypothetical protein
LASGQEDGLLYRTRVRTDHAIRVNEVRCDLHSEVLDKALATEAGMASPERHSERGSCRLKEKDRARSARPQRRDRRRDGCQWSQPRRRLVGWVGQKVEVAIEAGLRP